jgi:hypothetical protein
MKHELKEKDFIEAVLPTDKRKSTNREKFLLKYVRKDSEKAIFILDPENILSYYKPVCEVCGKEMERTGKTQKMCKECWKEKFKELNKINNRNYRKNKLN